MFLIVVAYVQKKCAKICTEKLDFCVVHPDMAVYIRIVPILEKLRTVRINASASVHWPWFSKKNLQPQGLQILFREPWPKYKSFGIVQSLVFPKLGQVLIVLLA